MGNPDLELQQQNPGRDPLRRLRRRHRRQLRRHRDAAALYVAAIAATMLLALGVWGVLVNETTTTGTTGTTMTTATTMTTTAQCLPRPLRLLVLGPLLGSQPCPERDATHGDGRGGRVVEEEEDALTHIAVETDELLRRRNVLAQALHKEGIDAFIVEPGATFEFYANISRATWEALAPSPRLRPLLVIQPSSRHAADRSDDDNGDDVIVARAALLTPRTLVGQVRALLASPEEEEEEEEEEKGMRQRRQPRRGPSPSPPAPALDIVVWEPQWNPYETLRKSRLFAPADPARAEAYERGDADRRPVVMVDPETRALVVDGLGDAGFRYSRLASAVARLVTPPSLSSSR
ncbi:hypothetical protein IF1G_03530 [Cordyceps javanica]|uniref:Uncharacterized protein n=1 Tax=Cordyceps javanica TaxID=43265 RepID=A0A545W503_9HYPO|nr:hypothetical protein IF1G_03530 [Cordyceps javanica]TQW09036.1 hypothetical protein IF2G_03467 [Cordyceps javanica]